MPRVAFVVASHSQLLALGVAELAAQMAPDVHFSAAGGMDDGSIGTSYDKIEAAVQAALEAVGDGEGAGVVILTDLGSATMTVEAILDFADEADRLICVDAPLVEAAIAGAVRAQLGDSLAQVVATAQSVCASVTHAQTQGNGAAAPDTSDEGDRGEQGQWLRASAKVADPMGLHARPAALIARLAGEFDVEATINGADAGSVLELMALGVAEGETVDVKVCGDQAAEALAALVEAIEASQ